METMQKQEQRMEIDLFELGGALLGRFWIILFAGILAALCALVFTKLSVTPTYTSSTKIYILNQKDDDSSVTNSDLSLSATLASDYSDLIKDRTVAESVISELGLSITADELIAKISVTMPDSGRIITISVTDSDPYMAAKIVTSVREMSAEHIKEVMGLEAVNVVEEADIPQGETYAAYRKNAMIGFLAGAVIAIAIILIQFMINDTVKSQEDVERYLSLSVLGSIPMMESEKGKRKERKKKKEIKEEAQAQVVEKAVEIHAAAQTAETPAAQAEPTATERRRRRRRLEEQR